jgi:hypothetical protein
MLQTSSMLETHALAIRSGPLRTRETYRQLMRRGLTSTEAANLVAYLNGLRVDDTPWTLGQVNRLLFLRHLYRAGRLGEPSLCSEESAA